MTTTIGALTNVPNPGSPITSPWAQDVTRLARHTFTNAAALLAQWPTATNGSHAMILDTGRRAERVAGAWVYVDPLFGIHTDTMAAAAETGTLSYGVTFTAAPVVVGSVQVGSNADLVLQWQNAPGTGGVGYRVATASGNTYTGGYAIHWVAYGTRLVT